MKSKNLNEENNEDGSIDEDRKTEIGRAHV